ncbi:hypothetical protein ACSBPU_06820 [Parapusillimonas sp. JC17]|uniref:hypothetical protein n=1 Tax=Parapusillimonas sp. JC17 TaxID=3445768 RepID=UPI003FA00BB7
MSIILRRNKHTARIMRQQYVRKGAQGNQHGYVRTIPLATISLSAVEVPGEIAELLSTKELAHLEKSIIFPARNEAERKKKEQEARECDPNWRVTEAINFLQEAGRRAQLVAVDPRLLEGLHETVAALGPAVIENLDPLDAVSASVRAAISAVEQGRYGRNQGPVRKDAIAAKKWAELRALVLERPDSLVAALQDAGWVATRDRRSR